MTRGLFIFRNREGEILLVIFVNHDSYPAGWGSSFVETLVEVLKDDQHFGQVVAAVASRCGCDGEAIQDWSLLPLKEVSDEESTCADYVYEIREAEAGLRREMARVHCAIAHRLRSIPPERAALNQYRPNN